MTRRAVYFVGYHIVESHLLLIQIKLEAPWFETYELASAVEDFFVDANEAITVLTKDGNVKSLASQESICIDKYQPLLCWTALIRVGERIVASGWNQNSRYICLLLLSEDSEKKLRYLSNEQLRASRPG